MKLFFKLILFFSLLILMKDYNSAQTINYVEESKKVVYELKDLKFDEVYARFDSVVSKILTKQKLESTWKSFIQQVGEFKAITKDTSYKYQNYPLVVLTVKFERMEFAFIFAFNSSNQLNTFRISPVNQGADYKNPPYAKLENFLDKAVYFGKEGWNLPGTLYTPKGEKLFPGVVLVHGSGPNDRDETIGPNKVFKDLALGLASKGIAVLTYDKRTKVYMDKLMSVATFTVKEEVIDDAIEAVEFLKKQKNVDSNRIYIVGHSLGAMLAPRIIELNPSFAGIVMLAAPTDKLEDLLLSQVIYISNLDGKIEEEEKTQIDTLKIQVARLKSSELNLNTPSDLLPMNSPASYWIDLKNYNQLETAKNIKKPILILQGERDYQVDMAQYDSWTKGLKDMPNVSFKTYPKLYHLFIEGEGKSTPQEYLKEGHVAVYVIDDIVNWINGK